LVQTVCQIERLHSGAHDEAVFLYAFDLLHRDGFDLRTEPLATRKANSG
jgi:ATP-dependent DNA ligase